jgi:hypothetical protein
MATKLDRFPKKYFTGEYLKQIGPLGLEIEAEKTEGITDQKTGRTTEKSVLSFVGTEKRLILNGTNFDLIVEITGCDDSRDWPGHKIELFADKTTLGAKRVDCVRARAPAEQPALAAAAPKSPSPTAGASEPAAQPALMAAAPSPSASATAGAFDQKMDDEIPF